MENLPAQRAAREAAEFEQRLATRRSSRDIRLGAPEQNRMRAHPRRQSAGQAPARKSQREQCDRDGQERQLSDDFGDRNDTEFQPARESRQESRQRHRDRSFEQDGNAEEAERTYNRRHRHRASD